MQIAFEKKSTVRQSNDARELTWKPITITRASVPFSALPSSSPICRTRHMEKPQGINRWILSVHQQAKCKESKVLIYYSDEE